MKTVCTIDTCTGCGACVDICPQKCISLSRDYFTVQAVIGDSCVNCKACEKVCPRNKKVLKRNPVEWFQGWANPEIRRQGSSGGLATAIMTSFLKEGGSVCACLYNSGTFSFKIIEDVEQVELFSGSKYVKSDPEGIYISIKEMLKRKPLLFVGLPCQVAAVQNYFNYDENLYTIDLICHGTPNVQLLDMFLSERGFKLSDLKDITFRDKHDKNDYIKLSRCVDEYMLAFLYSICYTNNCYSCDYAEISRVSDITLGDSWGTELTEELNGGISLVLVQTTKGHDLLEKCGVTLKQVNLQDAIRHNHQLEKPVDVTESRQVFIDELTNGKTFSEATFRAIPKAVIIQKLKRVRNLVTGKRDKNQFGLSVLK